MKSKQIIIEDEEEENDDEFMEEQKKMLENQHEKELKEQNQFECLCDGVMNGFHLLQSSFNELLDLKDEMLQHHLPPSLQVSIIITIGKLFRSITGLDTPLSELTRLVKIFSIPWQKRSESLKKLHQDYENKKRELDISLRRVNIMEKKFKLFNDQQTLINWEKVFVKMMMGSSEGRKWKFHVKDVKRKLAQGVSLSQLKSELSNEEKNSQTTCHNRPIDNYEIPGLEDNYMLYGSPDSAELYDGYLTDDDSLRHHAVTSYEDKSVGTDDDCEERKLLAVRLYKVPQKDKSPTDLKCTISSGNQSFAPFNLIKKDGKPKTPRSSSRSSRRPSPLPRIKMKNSDSEKRKLEKEEESYEEVIIDINQHHHDLNIKIEDKEHNLVGKQTLTWQDISSKNLIELVKTSWTTENQKELFENELKTQQVFKLPIETGNTGKVSWIMYWIKERKDGGKSEIGCNTKEIETVIEDLTGINLKRTNKEEIENLMNIATTRDSSTSPLPLISSTHHEHLENLMTEDEINEIKLKHNTQIKNIQEDYERKLKELLNELEELRQNKSLIENTDKELNQSKEDVCIRSPPPNSPVKSPTNQQTKRINTSRDVIIKRKFKWGSDKLPDDVWERMRILTEDMIEKRQIIDANIRKDIAANIEQKLASQYKLERNMMTSSNQQDDVILPALFMPTSYLHRKKILYTSQGHHYFHNGKSDIRITQPPSIFQLPPLHEKKSSPIATTVNLFELNRDHPTRIDQSNHSAPLYSLHKVSAATSGGNRTIHTTPSSNRWKN